MSGEVRVAAIITLSSLRCAATSGHAPGGGNRPAPKPVCGSSSIRPRASAPGAADGVLVGAQGDAEVVSFHALKPLSAGEGGAVFCRDEELAAEVTSLINFSFDPRHQVQRPDALGRKAVRARAAAVGLASLQPRTPRTIELRRGPREPSSAAAAGRLRPAARARTRNLAVLSHAGPDPETRRAVLAASERRGIALRTYYDPLHQMPAFANFAQADELETTRQLGEQM